MTARNVSPPVRALEAHGRLCAQCNATARAGLPYVKLCAVGRLLAEMGIRAIGTSRRLKAFPSVRP